MSRYLSYVHDLKNKLTLLYAISRKARQTQNLSEDKVNAVIDRINEILKILSSDFDFESEGIISLKSYGLNDLNEFLISAMNKIKLLYPDMNIEYFKLIEKWDDKIHFDKDLLYQVIENAIENSNNAQAKKVEMSLSKENDFVILDFEGEPESTIRDRKIKQPPLKDLAGLFRSFHYALFASILNNPDKLSYKQEHLFEAGEKLFTYVVAVCMDAYLQRIYSFGELNIGYKKEQEFILMYHMTEKAIYELGYELNSRPDWAIIPLKGIASILKTEI